MRYPSIKSLACDLRCIKVSICYGFTDEEGNVGIDVRLQVTDEGWYVHEGDPQYDQDHRGCWGAGFVTRQTNCRELAAELIAEARDMDQWR